eukprot:7143019-Pyramimonas_sp.AAC.1
MPGAGCPSTEPLGRALEARPAPVSFPPRVPGHIGTHGPQWSRPSIGAFSPRALSPSPLGARAGSSCGGADSGK